MDPGLSRSLWTGRVSVYPGKADPPSKRAWSRKRADYHRDHQMSPSFELKDFSPVSAECSTNRISCIISLSRCVRHRSSSDVKSRTCCQLYVSYRQVKVNLSSLQLCPNFVSRSTRRSVSIGWLLVCNRIRHRLVRRYHSGNGGQVLWPSSIRLPAPPNP